MKTCTRLQTFFFNLFILEKQSTNGKGRDRERASQADSVLSTEPVSGLDLRTPGSPPEPKPNLEA